MVNRNLFRYLLGACLFCFPLLLKAQGHPQLELEKLPPAPARQGMFLGSCSEILLGIGGRAPDGRMTSDVYILPEGADAWQPAAQQFLRPLGYGVSFSYGGRMIIAGGSDGENHSRKVYAVSYGEGGVLTDSLASLPFPLANMTGAMLGDALLIAGGNQRPGGVPGRFFLMLDMAAPPGAREWVTLEPWPGPGRTGAVSVSVEGDFYLFGGSADEKAAGDQSPAQAFRDAYRFIPAFSGNKIVGGTWERLTASPTALLPGPGPALTLGLDHILFPGASSRLWVYHIGTDTWLDFGELPGKGSGAVAAVKRGPAWVLLNNGENASESMLDVFALSKKKEFGWINWLTLAVYLCFMLWIGFIYDRKGEQTADNFFTAGGRIPWWAAGLSIFGTQLSAISFMAIPAIVFATDWSLAIGSVLILATVPIVSRYYIPFFRKLSITSAYEYLEHRFNRNVRLLGSLSFILFQMGRMGIVLYLPAVAIASVTGSDVYLLIAIMGVICIMYTVMGGIEAVIWTDFAQVVVLFGGAVACLFVATANIEGGVAHVITQGLKEGKFTLFHLGWRPDSPVLWVCIVGFFFLNIIPYTSDQTVVQRYLTVRDEKRARKSLWTNALVTLPGTVVFFGLGTVLYIFYKENPDVIASEKIDEILPYFVVRQLPAGVAGLVIAGIFAASQSTLSSSMNSISASYTSDVFQRFSWGSGERKSLSVARRVTVAAGIFGTGSAMIIAFLDVKFIFDLFQEVLGILGGSLAGVFVLGIFTKRANAPGVMTGLFIGALAVWLVKYYTDISVYLYGAISVLACVASGYLVSLLVPSGRASI